MKVSLNWIRDYLDLHKSAPEIADILTSLGLEVEGWEAVRPSPVDMEQVVTALVTACERIPDTDHLSATLVDTGNGQPRSIVCGAPNVAVGQKVFVALPGAQVFSKDGQLFTIGERKVKGVPSQGMICAQDELGVGHDHSGIMVLPGIPRWASPLPRGLSRKPIPFSRLALRLIAPMLPTTWASPAIWRLICAYMNSPICAFNYLNSTIPYFKHRVLHLKFPLKMRPLVPATRDWLSMVWK